MRFHRLSIRKKIALSALIAVGFVAPTQMAVAASSTWNVNAAGNWATAGSWAGSVIPGATSDLTNTDVATFGTIITAARIVTVDANRSILGIDFAGNSSAYTLATGNLLLNNGGSISSSGGGSAHTDIISAAIRLENINLGSSGAASFSANSTTAARLLSITGGVTGNAAAANTTTLTLDGTNTGANAVSGIIGNGSGGGNLAIIKNGTGTWRLTGANTFTGGVTLNTGVLAVGNATALGTGLLTINGGSIDASAATVITGITQNWAGNFTYVGTSTLTLPGAITMAAPRTVTATASTLTISGVVGDGVTTNVFDVTKAGAGTIAYSNTGTVAVRSGGQTFTNNGTGGSVTSTNLVNLGANALSFDGTGNSTFTGIFSGTGGSVVKLNTGTVSLNAANTYTGGTTVKAGLLSTNNAAGFGTGTIVLGDSATNNAAVISIGANVTVANAINLTTLSNGVLTLRTNHGTAGQNPTYSGAITTTSGTPTLQTVVANNGGMNLNNATFNPTAALVNMGTGSGSVTISGSIGTNVTSITQNSPTSTLILSGSNTYNNGISIKAGTLRLSTSATAGGPATNIITLGDTTGALAANLSQNFGGTTANPIVLATGTTGTLTIDSPNTGTLGVLSGGVTGTNNFQINGSNTQGISFTTGAIANIGTVTNVGTGAGAAQISSNITNTVTNVTQNSATSNLRLSGTNTYGTTTVTSGVLSFLTTSAMPGYPNPTGPNLITVASGGTVALGYGAASGQFSNADILALGSTGTPISFAATGASLGIDTTSAAGGTATYSGVISNPTGIALGFNKVGAGTLILTGANTYTGPTMISQGFLSAVPGVGIPATSNLNIAGSGGTGVNFSGTFIPAVANFEMPLGTGAGQAQVLGTNSGFTSQLANQVIALGTIASPTPLTWGSASFSPVALVLNETGATNTIDFRNPINFDAAARTVTVNATGAANAATLSGVLSSNTTAGGLTKNGGGILNITNATNSYTGPTALIAGTLSFNGAGALPTGSTITTTAGTTLQIFNNGVVSNSTLAYGNTLNLLGTAATTINVGSNGGAFTGNTIAMGDLNAPATSTNTATTTNFNGTEGYGISFTSLNLPGGTGQTTTFNANANVTILGNVTNRMSGTITSGQLDTLVLQGSATGSSINGIIADGTGRTIAIGGHTIITKAGTGTWTLRGANTYSGGTNVNAGTLVIDGSAGGSIGPSLVTVGSAGGTLNILGNTTIGSAASTLNNTVGSVVVVGGATATTRGTVSLVDGSINTLTITGNSFGTPALQSFTLGGIAAGDFSVLNFDSNNSSVDNITLAGGNSNKVLLQLGGATVNVNALPATALPTGIYNLLTFATGSTFTGAFTLGSVTTAPGTLAYLNTPTSSSANLTLNVIAAASGNIFWTGTQPAWNSNPTGPVTGFVNAFSSGANALLPGSTANVFLTDTSITGNFSHTTGQSFTINSLNFTGTGTPAATNSITLAGTSPLTLLGSAAYSDQNSIAQGANTALAVQAGSAAHTISSPIAIGANQVWQHDSANALTVSGAISGTGTTLAKAGSGTVILTGTNTFDGALTISGGSVQLGAAGTTGSLAPASTLVINSNLTINRTNAVVQGTDLSSSVISGSGTLTQAGSGTTTLTADNTYLGGTTISAGILQVGNAGTTGAAGSGAIAINTGATLAFNRTNNLNLAATNLVTGAGTVRLASGGTVTAAIDGQFNTTGNLTFGAAANGTTGGNLDLTNSSSTFGGLLSQTNTTTVNTITIGTGKTLTINGNVEMANTADNADNFVTMTGGGNLTVTGATFFVGRNTGGTNIGSTVSMDLSGLNTFNANLSGNLVLQQTGDNNTADAATLKFATNNTITAASILVGNSATASSNLLVLGSGTNELNASTIGIGVGGRDGGVVNFAGTSGSVKIRGTDGIAPAIFNLATGTAATGVAANFNFDVTGHNADLLLSTLSIGTQNRAATMNPSFSFNQGTMTMDSLTMATRSVAGSTANGATAGRTTNATLNIGGGTVNILNGILALGQTTVSSNVGSFVTTSNGTVNISGGTVTIGETAGTSVLMAETTIANVAASGTLNFTGGSTTFAGDILKVGGAGTTATFTLNGGSVNMSNKNIGSATLIDNINLQSGTLSNVNQINNGAAVSKTTSGILNYTGTNAYSGATTVVGGTLNVSGSLTNSIVTVNSGATIGGNGTITNAVNLDTGSTLSPGNSPGTLTTGAMTWTTGANYNWQATNLSSSAPSGSNFDSLIVSGTLDIQSGFNFNLWSLSSTGPDVNGNALGFSAATDGYWKVATATLLTGAGNLSSAVINVSAANGTAGFTNPLLLGGFTLVTGNTTPVPGATANDVYLKFATASSGSAPDLAVGTVTNPDLFVLRNASLGTATASVALSNGNSNTGSVVTPATYSNPVLTATTGQSITGSGALAPSLVTLTDTTSNLTALAATVTYQTTPTDTATGNNTATVNVRIGNAPLHPTTSSTTFGSALTASTPINVTPYTNLSSNTIGETATGSTVPALGTTATIFNYTNSTGTDTGISMAWRSRTAAEASNIPSLNDNGTLHAGYLISDVVDLTGMQNTVGGFTDTFILQLSYSQALLDGYETDGVTRGKIFVASKVGNAWVNAVNLNSTNAAQYFPNQAYNASARVLGDYGVDPINNVVWAVLNHNSEFAVVPEPSTLVLGGLALLGFAGAGLRRRRMAKPQA